MREGWVEATLGDVLSLSIDKVPVDRDESYDLAGVFSFGRGLFRREPLSGSKTSYGHFNRLRTDCFVLSRLKAWEGAVAVVSDQFDGCVLSPEFPTYEVTTSLLLPDYLRLLASHESFWELLATTSTGMGGRKERVHQQRILSLPINLPPLAEQRRIVDLVAAVDASIAASERMTRVAAASLDAISNHLFVTADRAASTIQLGDVVDINPEGTNGWSPSKPVRYVDLSSVSAGIGIDEQAVVQMPFADAPSRARRVMRTGDVLVATVRPYLRGFALVGEQWDGEVASTGFAVLRPKDGVVVPGFVWSVVSQTSFVEHLMERATGSSYPAVRPDDIVSFPLLLPSIEEQQSIAETLAAVDTSGRCADSLKRSLARARLALLADLLSGNHEIPESYDELLEDVA